MTTQTNGHQLPSGPLSQCFIHSNVLLLLL